MNKITDTVKQNIRWIIAIICVIILIFVIENIFDNEIQNFDMQIYSYVSKLISTNVTTVMKIVTTMASASVLCGLCLTFLAFVKNKKYGLIISLNIFISTILNLILKNIFNRPRPEGYRLIEETGFSFPSGHSMASMAFYGLIIYLVFKKVQNKYVKWILISILSILIISVGISRIYLGVHYASDVLGGFCFSIIYLACYTHFIKNIIE